MVELSRGSTSLGVSLRAVMQAACQPSKADSAVPCMPSDTAQYLIASVHLHNCCCDRLATWPTKWLQSTRFMVELSWGSTSLGATLHAVIQAACQPSKADRAVPCTLPDIAASTKSSV